MCKFLNYIGLKPTHTSILHHSSKKLKRISARHFIQDLEQRFITSGDFFFDDNHFYWIYDGRKISYKLIDIVEICKIPLENFGKGVWQVYVNQNGANFAFQFVTNYSLFNHNFPDFYERVKEVNPEAIKSIWNIWAK